MTKEEYLARAVETYDALKWFYDGLTEYVKGVYITHHDVVEVDGKRYEVYICQLPEEETEG